MKKILVVGAGKLPIPATKGGAVPMLLEELFDSNEAEMDVRYTCMTPYDESAKRLSSRFKKTDFVWVNFPVIARILDRLLSRVVGTIKPSRVHSFGFLARSVWFVLCSANEMRRGNYDHVLFENSIVAMLSLRLFGNRTKYGNKYSLHLHSVPSNYYQCAADVRNSKKLLFVSEYVLDQVRKSLNLKNDDQLTVVKNRLRLNLFYPLSGEEKNEARGNLGIDSDAFVVVFAGRFSPEKGLAELIQSMEMIDCKKLVLCIAGSTFYNSTITSPYTEKLKKLARDSNKDIRFTGFVEYSRMREIYGMADVVALPSVWDEPAGMTMIEALACGVPLVTTHSGGIPEYVGKDTCIFVERENLVNNLAREISKIAAGQDCSMMVNNGLARVKTLSHDGYSRSIIEGIFGREDCNGCE